VRERSPEVTIAEVEKNPMEFPGSPYDMWVRGELDDYVHAPEGSRVEVIGERVVVSPPAVFPHNAIVQQVADTLAVRRHTVATFPWRCVAGTGLSIGVTRDGYIPDLLFIEAEIYKAAERAQVPSLVADQVELVLEVTSPSNGSGDREPDHRQQKRKRQTKWQVYSRAEIPYYLLIDRDPKVARTTLYSIPDAAAGAYLHEESWEFGEPIELPDPFGFQIPTAEWEPWI
jgi:Uma2 family endonuclease